MPMEITSLQKLFPDPSFLTMLMLLAQTPQDNTALQTPQYLEEPCMNTFPGTELAALGKNSMHKRAQTPGFVLTPMHTHKIA